MRWLRIFSFFKRREHKLEAELRFHFEELVREKIAAGSAPAEARREAAIEFGSMDQIKEECRDERFCHWIETILQDIRYSIRTLRRSPGFTLGVLSVLTLGIGANTAIFSFVDGVLLKPLPYPEGERIIVLSEKSPSGTFPPAAVPTYRDWSEQNTVFENMAACRDTEVVLSTPSGAVRLLQSQVTAHYFDVFRVNPYLGRAFLPNEDQPGRDNVAILTNRLWRARFNAAPDIIGRVITLNGSPSTIIGVMPPGVLDRGWARIFTPLVLANENNSRNFHYLKSYAMLKPEISLEQAQAEMEAITSAIASAAPETNKNWGVGLFRYATAVVGTDQRGSLYLLMVAVSMLLIIACANLANLTLARGVFRKQEIEIRIVLGASRSRIVKQLFTESVLLCCAGGMLGFLFAFFAVAMLKTSPPGGPLPETAVVNLDGRAFAFTFGVTLFTGILFGLMPAIKTSRCNISSTAKSDSTNSLSGLKLRGIRELLIISEIAIAFVLLCGAGLLARSLFQLQQVKLGFDSRDLATAYLPISHRHSKSSKEFVRYLHDIIDRVNVIPGVNHTASASAPPINWGWGNWLQFQVAGSKNLAASLRPGCGLKIVSSTYFETLGMRLIQGRLLNERDVKSSRLVTVINETMAKQYFADRSAIGEYLLADQVIFGSHGFGPEIAWEIVGVVADEKDSALRYGSSPGMYVAFDQSPNTWQFLLVRSTLDSGSLAHAMTKALHELDQDQVLDGVVTLDEVKSNSIIPDRRRSSLLGMFAGIALLLAGSGLYSTISYSVAQRTREIGIRTALGATPANIIRLVLSNGLKLTLIGLTIGFGGAISLGRLLASLLFNVGKYDAFTLISVFTLLILSTLSACYLPARRASKLNPLSAIRYE